MDRKNTWNLYISIYIYIYIYRYLFISIYVIMYIYWKKNGMFCVLLQKKETFSRSFTFFAKEHCVLCILLRSLQKTERSLCSFAFFWKERERTERSFGSHQLLKTKKKNGKERNVLKGKEPIAQPWYNWINNICTVDCTSVHICTARKNTIQKFFRSVRKWIGKHLKPDTDKQTEFNTNTNSLLTFFGFCKQKINILMLKMLHKQKTTSFCIKKYCQSHLILYKKYTPNKRLFCVWGIAMNCTIL